MTGQYEQDIIDCQTVLDQIKTWVDVHPFDQNVRYLISYSVIKSCSTLEMVLKRILYDTLADGANEYAQNFLENRIIDASFNPSTGKIEQILSEMNVDWNTRFTSTIKGTNEKGQLTSLINLRNDIAHGRPINSSIDDTIVYFIAGKWVLEQVWNILQT